MDFFANNTTDVFNYRDYRRYLRDAFSEAKKQKSQLSLATVGKKLGLNRVSVKNVLDGKRHIADDRIRCWAESFRLRGERQKYFESLVRFNKARRHDDKNLHFESMLKLKQSPLRTRYLDSSSVGFVQAWYFPVIAELSTTPGFKRDVQWIKRRLAFPVSTSRIEKALAYLEHHGFLEGESCELVKTTDEFTSHIYKDYVVNQTELGAQAVASQPREKREAFNLTIAVNQRTFAIAKDRLARFRHELHELLSSDDAKGEPCDQVIQVNMTMFTAAQEDV